MRTTYIIITDRFDLKQAAKVSRVDRDIPKSSSKHPQVQSGPRWPPGGLQYPSTKDKYILDKHSVYPFASSEWPLIGL